MVVTPENTLRVVEHDEGSQIDYDDKGFTHYVAFFLAELAVDYFLPPPAYFLQPMSFARSMEILGLAANECTVKEIRKAPVYEALDFLSPSFLRK